MTFREADLEFGKVRGIDGNKITVRASKLECNFNNKIELVEVGVFVNCGAGHGDTICSLNKIQIEEIEKKVHDKDGNITFKQEQVNTVELSIVGHIKDGVFSRGIDRLPSINCECYLLTDEQTNCILGINEKDDC